MDYPLVSVIINCHNGERYLKECIESVLNQSYKNWELIFFDNCSNDSSKKIFNEYLNNNNFYYKKSDKILNLYDARNKALNFVQGKYVCYLDCDDTWSDDKLEKQVNFLEKNKNFELVYSNFFTINENKNFTSIRFKNTLPEGFILQNLLKEYSIGILTVCFRSEILKNYFFNEKYNIIGDFDLIIRMSKQHKIGCIQEPLAFYRIHENNFSHKINLYINELTEWINQNNDEFNLFYTKIYLLKLKIKKILSFFYLK